MSHEYDNNLEKARLFVEWTEDSNEVSDIIFDFNIVKGEISEKDIEAFAKQLMPGQQNYFESMDEDRKLTMIALNKMDKERLKKFIAFCVQNRENHVLNFHDLNNILQTAFSIVNHSVNPKFVELQEYKNELEVAKENQALMKMKKAA